MPSLRMPDGCNIHFRLDDYTDPWTRPEAVVFLHGNAESGLAWYGWVPHFARHFKVIRPDMRGFGDSSPMPADYNWSATRIVDDYLALLDHLGVARVHVVAAKLGSLAAMRLAAQHPDRVATLTVAGVPASISKLTTGGPSPDLIEKGGVEAWAKVNMAARLGESMPAEAVTWWTQFMGRTASSTQIGFVRDVAVFDIFDQLEKIVAPTLVITTEGSGIGSVAETAAWQQRISRSSLLVLPGKSYHVAASSPDLCANKTLEFIRSVA